MIPLPHNSPRCYSLLILNDLSQVAPIFTSHIFITYNSMLVHIAYIHFSQLQCISSYPSAPSSRQTISWKIFYSGGLLGVPIQLCSCRYTFAPSLYHIALYLQYLTNLKRFLYFKLHHQQSSLHFILIKFSTID